MGRGWIESSLAVLCLLSELVLAVQLIAWKRRSFFLLWVLADSVSSVVLLVIYLYWGIDTNLYAYTYMYVEPILILFLALAGVEATSPAVYGWGLAFAVAVVKWTPFPLSHLPLHDEFLARAAFCTATAAAIAINSGLVKFNIHQAIMAAWCLITLLSYFTIIWYGSLPEEQLNRLHAIASVFILGGHTMCYMGWIWLWATPQRRWPILHTAMR